MENQQQPANTNLCRAGCGFFGADSNEGLCSKCYKDHIKRKQDTARISPTLSVPMAQSSSSSTPHLSSTVMSAVVAHVEAAAASASSSSASSSTAEPMSCSAAAHAGEEATAKLESALASGADVILSSSSSACGLDTVVAAVASASAGSLDGAPPPKKVNRCHMCKKRVGLTGFSCRCGGLYCSEHRYDNVHSCTFDYKTMEREQIAKNNPVVVSDKIQRI